MPSTETADVLIAGAGIMGSATAYALTHAPQAPKRVVIVERDPGFSETSTPRSAGGVRQQFSTPENIQLSQATLAVLANLKAQFGPDADLAYKERGYLILAASGGEDILRQNAAVQRAQGADTQLLDPGALKARFPWLSTEGVALGSFGPTGEGWLDPAALMTLLRKAAVAKGATVIYDTVSGFTKANGQISHVHLASGRSIAVGAVVNAAGAWSGVLAGLAGVPLPVEPRKRYVYVVDCRDATDALRQGPLVCDCGGVWMRPEGRTFICGVSPSEADEPAAADLESIDYAPYEDTVWPALAVRIPAFESLKLISAWAGYYDYNTLDQNAVIGRHPELRNFYITSGFSGHGLQQGYAAGRAIAELILHGRFVTLDLTRFGYERVIDQRPLFELNVI